jgi:hypothetical protein
MTKPKDAPIRSALVAKSALRSRVRDGLRALHNDHLRYIEKSVRDQFADSIDLDVAFQEEHAQSNRWDYLLGHSSTGQLIAVEPHSATDGEIATVIRKREAARGQLRDHLAKGKHVSRWLWVASGKVHFSPIEKARRRLDQNGIEFVGKCITARHLPVASMDSNEPLKSSRRPKRIR